MIDYKGFDKNFNLTGKTAVITGGAKGIGRAIATLYAEKGANIGIFDIAEDEGRQVADDLSSRFGIRSEYFHTDLLKVENIQNSVDKAEESFGSLDILVNNAGVVFLDDAESISEQDWDLTMGVNMRAVFLVSQIVGRKMIANGRGKIVNMASQAGVIALDKHIAYCAAKAAVISMTKVLAYEWAEFGINVNAISPTVVLTELGKKAWGGEKGEAMKKQIPNGRFAYPEEIAAVAVFLASDASAMINGENILIDGGYTIK
jgi:NAD(P)-dependent dehydrogenase (short-subunit alcohol dehydrogenase family)